MHILFIGDIVGSPGRQIVRDRLADLISHRQIDLVIANGENSASGFGITPKIADDLLSNGVDVVTGGNHSWDRKEILEYMPHQPRLLRPGNFPEGSPGSGTYIGTAKNGVKFAVINLQGRVFLPAIDDPFRKVDSELAKLPEDVAFVFVDMHAETTSEKIALGWYLDGRVSVVVGTHTHIPTADAQILTGGTAYQSDAGMTGDYDSVIGVKKDVPILRFTRKMPTERMSPA
ncbi:MAG: TIGR00282 family metallophosphoesterase, partial [Acidobacteria bacterium]|nr:TIGR00282 family metallophosphoesterase [Acidobacteriota bacterium]